MGLFLGADVFKGREDFLVSLAWKKCTLPWGVAFLRGAWAGALRSAVHTVHVSVWRHQACLLAASAYGRVARLGRRKAACLA